MPTTILDVANRAGVSSATVSRVLNNSATVMPETRERVLAAIKELEYTPNQQSRDLRKNESRMLLVMISEFSNPFYGDILAGMNQCANEADYNLLITATHSSYAREQELLNMLDRRQADGVVFMASTMSASELAALNGKYPVVQCCEYIPDIGVSYVSVDNYAAWYQATAHLARLGHRRIAMCSSTNNFISTHMRESAFRQALEDHGLEWDDRMIRRGNYSYESGYENAQLFLKMDDRPTAIMGICDSVAAGCVAAILNASLRVPQDVAVMGFDGLSMAKMVYPTLSTVVQPRTRLGFMSIKMLLDRIEGKNEVQELFLQHELIIRNSTMG